MRRAFTLLALSAAVLLADAGTADAQFRSRGGRGTAVISVGLGNHRAVVDGINPVPLL